jgi:PAS domain-containing protein
MHVASPRVDPASGRIRVGPAGISAVTPPRENGCVSARPELRQDAETLFRAVATVADAFYVVDANEQIAFANPASLRILGYTREEELLGRPSHLTIHYRRRDGSPYPHEECRRRFHFRAGPSDGNLGSDG